MINLLEFNNCYHDPCVNGTCIDGDNTYTCSCYDGYRGTDCDGKLSLHIFFSLNHSAFFFLVKYWLIKMILWRVCFSRSNGSWVFPNLFTLSRDQSSLYQHYMSKWRKLSLHQWNKQCCLCLCWWVQWRYLWRYDNFS